MTNLEFYKDELINIIIENMGVGKDGKPYSCSEYCRDDCIFQKDGDCQMMAKDWLFKEHKELIKLKQWEYDYIKVEYLEDGGDEVPIIHSLIDRLMEYGHFKSLKNMDLYNVYPKEILSNCIIVADDYDGLEDTK